MIYLFVEHFLTEEGKEYFPHWINIERGELKKFDGFVRIEQLEDMENFFRSILLLNFDVNENLNIWASSKEHELLIEKLNPLMIRKQVSQVFRNRPSIGT